MLLKYRDVMKRLAIGRTTLHELINAGMLTRKKLPSPPREGRAPGFMNRITEDSVEQYEQGRIKPAERSPAGKSKRPSAFRRQAKKFSHFQ